MRKLIAFLVWMLLHSGCASLSESQCAAGDWYTIGEADARNGYLPARIESHLEACAKYAVQVDPKRYRDGYQAGLRVFCTPVEGFQFGRGGGSYSGQCPRDMAAAFLSGYDLGRDLRALDESIREVDLRIAELREDAKDDEASEVAREAAARAVGFAKGERSRYENRRNDLLYRARERGYRDAW
jgi:Protein of unknown function (DUF2799)